MFIRLNFNSGTTVHQQVIEQISQMAAAGTLKLGDRIPTVRELAQELVINPNTVAKAYQELERRGVVQSRRGLGTFITEPSNLMNAAECAAVVGELIDPVIAQAERLGLDRTTVERIVEKRLDAHFGHGDAVVMPGKRDLERAGDSN